MAVIKVLKNGCGGAENHDLILFVKATQLKMVMVNGWSFSSSNNKIYEPLNSTRKTF